MLAEQISDALRDHHVDVGEPKERLERASKLATWGFREADVRLVGCYFEKTCRDVRAVSGCIVKATASREAFSDTLESAARWDSKQTEPGEHERQENIERESLSTEVDRQRQAMHAFNLLFSGRYSPERARREMEPMPTEEHFKTLVFEGTNLYDTPHPEIATELLLSGQASLLSLYLISHGPRRRPLKSKRNAAKVAELVKRYPQLAVLATAGGAET